MSMFVEFLIIGAAFPDEPILIRLDAIDRIFSDGKDTWVDVKGAACRVKGDYDAIKRKIQAAGASVA
jgi:hypothetical protein